MNKMMLSNNWQEELAKKPTYKFYPVTNEMKNEHDNTIVEEIEKNEILKNNVLFWNKIGTTLEFKIDTNDENEVEKIIVELQKTLNIKLRKVS